MADACTESVGVDAIEFEQGTGAEGRSRRLVLRAIALHGSTSPFLHIILQ